MNRRKLVEQAINGEIPVNTPVAPLIGAHSAMLYRESVKEAYRNPELMARLQIKAVKFYDIDIVFHYMDTTLEAEALGAKIDIKNSLPTIVGHLTEPPEPIFNEERGRIKIFVNALAKISKELSIEKIIGGYVLGPFTFLCQLFGIAKVFRKIIYGETSSVKTYIFKLSEYSKGYVDLLIDRGKADLIMVLEPCLILAGPVVFERYARRAVENLLSYIKRRGVYSAIHVCGRSNRIIQHLKNLSFDVIQLDCYVDLREAKKILANKCILGNIDTRLLVNSVPDIVFNKARECIERGGGRYHILSAGCEVPLRSHPENIKALVKAARGCR